ncbi:MAG: V-type ATP synthase subunit K [Candidatus Odinarchaeia archaeon]
MKKASLILVSAIIILIAVSIQAYSFVNALAQDSVTEAYRLLGAGLSIGLAGLGAGIGLGIAGAAAIGASTEKPEMLGKSIIFVVLTEAIAIYGLLISFLLLAGAA